MVFASFRFILLPCFLLMASASENNRTNSSSSLLEGTWYQCKYILALPITLFLFLGGSTLMRNPDCSNQGPNDTKKYLCPPPSASALNLIEYSNYQATCVSIDELCDGLAQCPSGEDEDSKFCLFHKAVRCSSTNSI